MKVSLTEEQKFQVLRDQLAERYQAAHLIRERGTKFTLWISGLGIGLAWLLVQQVQLGFTQKLSLTGFILSLSVAAWVLLRGQAAGLSNTLKRQARLEEALGLYTTSSNKDGEAILPESYRKAGVRKPWTKHFQGLVIWLVLLVGSLVSLTWACPSPNEGGASSEQSISQQEGVQ
jgi:hypothetical protein